MPVQMTAHHPNFVRICAHDATLVAVHFESTSALPLAEHTASPKDRSWTLANFVCHHFSDIERLVIQYADAMTRTPVEVCDALFAWLKEKFSDAGLVELTSAISWENYRARYDHAFGIEGENFSQGAVCAMPVRQTEVSKVS